MTTAELHIGQVMIPMPQNRRDLRNLCSALGITLTEKSNGVE